MRIKNFPGKIWRENSSLELLLSLCIGFMCNLSDLKSNGDKYSSSRLWREHDDTYPYRHFFFALRSSALIASNDVYVGLVFSACVFCSNWYMRFSKYTTNNFRHFSIYPFMCSLFVYLFFSICGWHMSRSYSVSRTFEIALSLYPWRSVDWFSIDWRCVFGNAMPF